MTPWPVLGLVSQRTRSLTIEKSVRTGERKNDKMSDGNSEDKPKAWQLDDPFEYAPEKPEGDPWNILLEPLLKKDRLQCDAWKEEVQNLLIFAGLFSAVVTAFVIESYQSLQPNVNTTMAGLLFYIANRLDNAPNGNTTSAFPSPFDPFPLSASFSPTPSSIRVNTFWFISLVLSLTTVLIGIISLQWLREHQSYPDLSPKQTFAVFRMRSDGLEEWHVSKVFTALPLLLQAALILFLGGLVDFLFALRNDVAVPVAVCIALTLLFLAATTTLPTLQGFALYFPFLYSRHPLAVPAQCPYKSPQSHAFRTMSHLGFRACSFLFNRLWKLFWVIRSVFRRLFHSVAEEGDFEAHHLIPYILPTWRQNTWTQFDLGWLSIRDAYLQGIYDQGSGLHKHRKEWNKTFPLFDALQGLREIMEGRSFKHTEPFLAAAYHAFDEISLSVIGHNAYFESVQHGPSYHGRHNQYLQKLLTYKDTPRTTQDPRLSEFIYIDTSSPSWDWSLNGLRFFEALHHENLFVFLTHVNRFRASQEANILSTHRLEIQIRLMRYVYEQDHKIQPIALESNIPSCLKIEGVDFEDLGGNADNRMVVEHAFYSQYLNVLASFFQNVGDVHPEEPSNSLYAHPHIPSFVQDASWITILATRQSGTHAADLTDNFVSITKSVAKGLEGLTDSESAPSGDQPGLLLYLAALYVKPLKELLSRDRNCGIYSGIDILLPIMRNYLQQHEGGRNFYLEDRFEGEESDGSTRFSPEWWEFLELQEQGLPSRSPADDVATVSSEGKPEVPEKRLSTSVIWRENLLQTETSITMDPPDMAFNLSHHVKQDSTNGEPLPTNMKHGKGSAQEKMSPMADNLV